MTFNEYLAERDIDCQTLAPELLETLRQQFDQHCQRIAPVAETLVEPSDCLHPRRAYRVAVIVADAAAAGITITRASDLHQ